MGRYELPLLFPEEFNDNAAKLLCAAEEIIIEECCANGCKHLPDGGFMGNRAQRPHDWFTASSDACWRCRSANPALARNKVAAEKGASKRAALKRARRNGEKF